MNAYIIINFIKSFHFISRSNFLFGYLKTSFDLLNKSVIIIFDIALLKNNGSDFMLGCELLIITFLCISIFSSLLRSISTFCSIILSGLSILLINLFIISHVKYSYSIIWVNVLSSSFCVCKMLMRFSYILFWG